MKEEIIQLLNKYLQIFPEEETRQSILVNYLNNTDGQNFIDWNNFNGHLVASGFVYAKEENKFLVLYHNDLKMYLYPGGHVDEVDDDLLHAAKREVLEETGLKDLVELKIAEDKLIPIDIDTHKIPFNEKLQLPEHYHFDFRYLFMVDRISNIKTDVSELSNYKWVSIDELSNDKNYGAIVNKISNILRNHIKRG